MNYLKFFGVCLGLFLLCFIFPMDLITSISNTDKELKSLKKELEDVKYMKKITDEVCDQYAREIKSLRKIIKDEVVTPYPSKIVTVDAEKNNCIWDTIKILSEDNFCVATILYKVNKLNKETMEYDIIFLDDDMLKRPNTYFRVWGIARSTEVVHCECFVEGKDAEKFPYNKITKGELLKLFQRPYLSPYQSPWITTVNSVLKAIVEKETGKSADF